MAKNILRKLEVDSSNGPDLLGTRILKRFAIELALPVTLMRRNILRDGVWPTTWGIHLVMPLYKKKLLQGLVLGPVLWNLFYADCKGLVEKNFHRKCLRRRFELLQEL